MNKIMLLAVVYFSFTIQSVTGFGGALIGMPIAILLVGMNEAKVVLNATSWFTGTILAIKSRRHVNCKILIEIILSQIAITSCTPRGR